MFSPAKCAILPYNSVFAPAACLYTGRAYKQNAAYKGQEKDPAALPAAEGQEASTIATKEPRRIRRAPAHAADAPAQQGSGNKKKTRSRKKHPVLSVIGRVIAVCFCLGVMACAAAAVWVCSYVVEATADDAVLLSLDNPTEMTQSSVVYQQNHDTGVWEEAVVYKSSNSHRIWVELGEISTDLQWAFICTEDKDFYTEPGVNFKRTIAAAINEYSPIKLFSSRQGASTIEQQLIKNILDENSSSGIEGAKRKLREIYRAIGLDNRYSKETILEAYLNTIPFTGTLMGVEAAANEYFGKSASKVTLAEAATIASITKNPTAYNPYTNPEQLVERRNYLLRNMYDQGKITEAAYREAVDAPLVLAEADTTAVVTTSSNNSYFEDALFLQLTEDIMELEECTKEEAQKIIYTRGLQIYATVDPFIQSEMEKIMLNTDDQYFAAGWHEEEVAQLSDDDIPVYNDDGTLKTGTSAKTGETVYYRKVRTQASMVTMDFAGNVLALVGGLGEKTSDLVLNRAYSVPRQTGSTMKPIGPYCLAIEYGLYNWSSMINDSPLYLAEDEVIKDDKGNWRDWPYNYSGGYSYTDIPLWQGLAKSMNTIAVRVGETVGADNIFNFAYNTLNLKHLDPANDAALSPMILGGQHYGVTTVELAAAFAIFNDGTYTVPHLYTEVYDASGNLYLEADATSYQALTPQTATIMNRLLRNVITSGTAAGVGGPKAGGMESVGKTGTASDWKDYAFVGLTPYYVTAVWWGFDNPYDMYHSGYSALKNNKPCIQAWKALMEAVQGDLEYRAFPMAEGVKQAAYCTESGLLAGPNCPGTATGYYKEDDMPGYCDLH